VPARFSRSALLRTKVQNDSFTCFCGYKFKCTRSRISRWFVGIWAARGGPAMSASEREIREYHDVRIVRATLTRRPVSASRGHIALRRRGQCDESNRIVAVVWIC